MLDKTKHIYSLGNKERLQGYNDPKYGVCLMAWESRARTLEFKKQFDIKLDIEKHSLIQLECMAMQMDYNIIVNMVIDAISYDIIDIKGWVKRHPKDKAKAEYLISKDFLLQKKGD